MDYKKIHDAIIANALARTDTEGYVEIHHILPRSFGGSDEKDNLVKLTGREHFLIHQLLAKMFPKTGMVHATFLMACMHKDGRNIRVNSRIFESLRIAHSKRVSENEEANLKKSLSLLGRKQSAEHVKARTEARKSNGKSWHSDETVKKNSESNTGKKRSGRKKGDDRSDVEKLASIKSAKTRSGRKMLPEQVAKSANSQRGKSKNVVFTEERLDSLRVEKSKKVKCPHCDEEGQMIVMGRWHFDNCKLKEKRK